MDVYPILSALITLPTALAILFLIGLLIHVKKAWIGVTWIGLVTVLFVAVSTPLMSHKLSRVLEEPFSPLKLPLADSATRFLPSAIVVLGGGRYSEAPEYGNRDTVSMYALERARYAAYLHRRTGLPILVTAGSVHGDAQPEGELLAAVLTQDFNVPVKWVERRSRTTFENARLSYEVLHTAGIKHIYLVTHALHMRRAYLVFEQTGLRITPAPLGFSTLASSDYGVYGYLPSANAFRRSSAALHEFVGHWWYQRRLRGEALVPASTDAGGPERTPSRKTP